MAYAKIDNVANAAMAKVSNVAKAAIGKIGSIDAPVSGFANANSIDFDGTNDHLISGSSITFYRGTISFWLKTLFLASEVEHVGNFIPLHLASTFYIYMSWNGSIIRSYVVHPATGSFYDNSTNIADEAWHFIALTIAGGGSGAENTGTIYVDGVAVATSTRTATYSAPSDTLKVGGNFSSSYFRAF